MLSTRQCYEIIGLKQGCTETEIKSAYKQLALKYHPDKNAGSKGAEEKFKQINNAYEILTHTPRPTTFTSNPPKPQPQPEPQPPQARQHPTRDPRGGTPREHYPSVKDLYIERTLLESAWVILTKWERTTKLSLEEAQPLRSLMIKNRAILDHLERPGADKFGIGVPSAWRKQGRVSYDWSPENNR
ncbi:DnaJ-domain-containing protein [Hyaloscypha variabilis F]|uniref:DnaJ-domain-containing protein n=1 Tax=Hyaloscypha variabilis (strain UAMH 11265 / GT02V1 / F) TaxID=1149755 RepID=A0A2J6QSX6_HYAVF|nr:DnaJ-domain-containing protein [Hyaloscypha variabilis F]